MGNKSDSILHDPGPNLTSHPQKQTNQNVYITEIQ